MYLVSIFPTMSFQLNFSARLDTSASQLLLGKCWANVRPGVGGYTSAWEEKYGNGMFFMGTCRCEMQKRVSKS